MKTQMVLREVSIALSLIVMQTTIIPLFAIELYVPDVVLLWVVYIALRFGQIEATIGGFCSGFLQDILAGQLLGLSALVKTITGFVAGYFYNENTFEQTMTTLRYTMIVFVLSLLHNGLYFFIFYQGVKDSVILATIETGGITTLYTTVFTFIPFFYYTRKHRVVWNRS
ncbi:MAG: rod shape-determining protein MreD [Bacteroidetes bacterium]|nr:rod shape-determining protein MreD [Bacteroidota bacterium]